MKLTLWLPLLLFTLALLVSYPSVCGATTAATATTTTLPSSSSSGASENVGAGDKDEPSTLSSSTTSLSPPIAFTDDEQVLRRVLRPARLLIRAGNYEGALSLLLEAVEKRSLKKSTILSSASSSFPSLNISSLAHLPNGEIAHRVSLSLLDHQIMAELITAEYLIKLSVAPNAQVESKLTQDIQKDLAHPVLGLCALEARTVLIKHSDDRDAGIAHLKAVLKHPEAHNDSDILFSTAKILSRLKEHEAAVVGFLLFLNATMVSEEDHPIPSCDSFEHTSDSNASADNNNSDNSDNSDNSGSRRPRCAMEVFIPLEQGLFEDRKDETDTMQMQMPMKKSKQVPLKTLPGLSGTIRIPYPETLDQAYACLSLATIFYENLLLWKHAELYLRCVLQHSFYAHEPMLAGMLVNAISFQEHTFEGYSGFGLISPMGLPLSDSVASAQGKAPHFLYSGPYKANPASFKLHPFSSMLYNEDTDESSDFERHDRIELSQPTARHWTAVKHFKAGKPVVFDNIATRDLYTDISYGFSPKGLLWNFHTFRGRLEEHDSHYVSFGRFPRNSIEQLMWVAADTLPKSDRASLVGVEWWITRRPKQQLTRGIPGETPRWHFDFEHLVKTGAVRHPKYIAAFTLDALGGPIIIFNSTVDSAMSEQFDASNHTSWLAPSNHRRMVIFPGHYMFGILPANGNTPGIRMHDNAVLWAAFWADEPCTPGPTAPGACVADDPPEAYEGGILPVDDTIAKMGREALGFQWQSDFRLVDAEVIAARKKPPNQDNIRPLAKPRVGTYSLRLSGSSSSNLLSGEKSSGTSDDGKESPSTSVGSYAGTQQEADELKEYPILNPFWNSWRVFGSDSHLDWTLTHGIADNRSCYAAVEASMPWIPLDLQGKVKSIQTLLRFALASERNTSPYAAFATTQPVNQTLVRAIVLAGFADYYSEMKGAEEAHRFASEAARIVESTEHCHEHICPGTLFNFTLVTAQSKLLGLLNKVTPFRRESSRLDALLVELESAGNSERLAALEKELGEAKSQALEELVRVGAKFPKVVESVHKLVVPYLITQKRNCTEMLPHVSALADLTSHYHLNQARVLCLIEMGLYEKAIRFLQEALENHSYDKYPCKVISELYGPRFLNDPARAARYGQCFDSWLKTRK